jgi:sugar lactone lactonase YvrE
MAATEPTVLLDGLAYVESARWHDGRFWFAHWIAGEIVAVDLEGRSEVVAHGPERMGWSIDWLPDGRMLVTGDEVLRHEHDGSVVPHADLSVVGDHGWNEIVVDDRGNTYLNGFDFDFLGGEKPRPGEIALVTAGGEVRQVADGIDFPNGMVITPDGSTLVIAESMAGQLTAFDIADDGDLTNRRVWADGIGPDGICLDADGAIWAQSADTRTHTQQPDAPAGEFVRVREGGEIVQRIPTERDGFACALGGPDGRTLCMLVAEWRGIEAVEATAARRTGQVLLAEAPAPHAGHP